MDAQRLGNTDAVCYLDHGSATETVGHQVLGDPASGVSGRSVDFGGVFSGEGSSSVSSPSSVSITDNFSAGESSISVGSSDDEDVAGVKDVSGVDEPFFGDGHFDHIIEEILSDLLVGHVGVVLARDQDGVDSFGLDVGAFAFVLDCDLDFGVGSHPGHYLLPAALFNASDESAGKIVGEGHEGGSLVAGVSNHQSLVSGSDFLVGLVNMDALGDVWRLFVDGHDDGGSLVVHADLVRVVADLFNSLTGNLLEVDLSLSADLSENHAD